MTPAPAPRGIDAAPGTVRRWAARSARALGACEAALGSAGLLAVLWTVLGSVVPAFAGRKPLDEGQHPASWGWVFAIFLMPPAAGLLAAGITLWERWPGRWWLQLVPLLLGLACLSVLTGTMKL